MSVLALVLVLGAACAHAAWNILAHGASRLGIPFLWCGAVVSAALWAIAVPFTGGIGAGAVGGFALGVGVSAVLHVVYMLVLQRGYAVGNLSSVYATARGTGPLLSVIAAIALLGERPPLHALVGVAVLVGGVVAIGFIDRPRGAGVRRGVDPGIVFGVLTGAAIAVYTIWDAFVVRELDVAPVAFMVGCTAIEAVIFSAVLLAQGRHRVAFAVARAQWPRLLAFGVLSPLSYILVLTAITIAPVALVAPLREVSVVMVSLFGAFVLREGTPGRRLAASAAVVGGIVLLAV